ncbi:MAG: efflux RND transporter periplasmic adaptor subunit [Anaerohalosphaeraceae bacterium]|nr:efflux RND transporter periplasmic adaptor subunit [Anaerohalosphaeraceae bacterium]
MKFRWKTIAAKWKSLGNKQKYIACLSAIIFILIVGTLLKSCKDTPDKSLVGRRIPVVLTPATLQIFEQRVVVQGNVEAKEFAMVSPRVQGVIEAVFVDEGDSVIANETKLFQTDALKLKQTVEIQKNELSVAQFAKRQSAANLEKIEADLHKTELDYNRFKRLFEKQAVTADAFEQQESRYKQILAFRKHAQAQVELSAEKEHQADAVLAISGKDLADAIVYAPISGKISRRLREPGETGQPGQPVVRIDDTSVVEVSAYLPAQYYSKIIPGQTGMNIEVSGIDIGQQIVSYKSPTINPKLRTFEIKCIIKKPPQGMVPGAIAQIEVVLESRKGLGVPAVAIQKRNAQSVIFVIKNDAAHMISVKTGLENDGWIEIIDSDLAENIPVVSMGQSMIEEGTLVSVQKEQM